MTADKETATKAAQCADLLIADIQALIESDNLVLAEYARNILEKFMPIANQLDALSEVVE